MFAELGEGISMDIPFLLKKYELEIFMGCCSVEVNELSFFEQWLVYTYTRGMVNKCLSARHGQLMVFGSIFMKGFELISRFTMPRISYSHLLALGNLSDV